MKDYRPLLSNVATLLDDLAFIWDESLARECGYDKEEVEALASGVTDLFNEIDAEVEGGERI